jgi:hypothetical protein
MDRDTGFHEVGNDAGLQIGKGQHEIGLKREDFSDIGGDEGGDARLFPSYLRGPHGITRNAYNPGILAHKIERLYGFFGKADNPAGRE